TTTCPATAGWMSGPVMTPGTTTSRGTAARMMVAATVDDLRSPGKATRARLGHLSGPAVAVVSPAAHFERGVLPPAHRMSRGPAGASRALAAGRPGFAPVASPATGPGDRATPRHDAMAGLLGPFSGRRRGGSEAGRSVRRRLADGAGRS